MNRRSYTLDNLPPHISDLPRFRAFLAGYQAEREGDALPDVDTLLLNDHLLPVLPEVAVFELTDAKEVKYRMCGTSVVTRLGKDPTGQDFLGLVPENVRAYLFDIMQDIAVRPCGRYSRYRNSYASGSGSIASLILLPVRGADTRDLPLLMGVFETEPSYSPRRDDRATQIVTDIEDAAYLDIGAGVPETSAQQRYGT